MHKQTLDAAIGGLLTGAEALGVPTAAFFSGDQPWSVRMAAKIAGGGQVSHGPMQSIFTHLKGEHPGLYLPTVLQDGKLRLPQKNVSTPDLRALKRHLQEGLSRMKPEEQWIGALTALLEDCLSYVPSGEPDISAFDRARMTATLASCISGYLLEQGKDEYPEGEFAGTDAFLLCSADFSGIQKFIFTVSMDKALASLRSRSFFLELLMEHYIDELLAACGLSRVNLLYSGGGHCYLLLPNTAAVREAVTAWNRHFNDWLQGEFGTQLFMAQGYTPCSANDLTNTPAKDAPYTAMFRRVSSVIAEHKIHRYTPEQILRLNKAQEAADGRECKVCGRSDRLNRENRCPWCELFVSLSGDILFKSVYLVSGEVWGSRFHLPGWDGSNRYIAVLDEKNARSRMKEQAAVRMYVKNRAMELMPNMTRIYVGDYAKSLSMEELASESNGIRRLAVCRMDVDDLGHAFVAGYRVPGETEPVKRDRYLNISRTAAFSRQMSMFFKGYINQLMGDLSVAIVYAGGDDVFLVGSWDAVIEAAQKIRDHFAQYSGGSLTISAGISMHDDHFPIRQAAAMSAELESCAKQQPGKDSVALLDDTGDHAYSWKTFREKVCVEKLTCLQEFFTDEKQERGNSFLYRLLDFLRQTEKDKINLARYAYLLAKMEPREKEKQKSYWEFSRKMYQWGLSAEDRRQLITAIYLMVYMERTEREGS